MTFLTKLGTIVLKIVGIASGMLPLIAPALGTKDSAIASTVADKLNQALGVISTSEQVFASAGTAKAGSAKLQAATPFIAALIQNTDTLIGKKPKDEAEFTTACTALTSALADVMNSFGE